MVLEPAWKLRSSDLVESDGDRSLMTTSIIDALHSLTWTAPLGPGIYIGWRAVASFLCTGLGICMVRHGMAERRYPHWRDCFIYLFSSVKEGAL